MSNKDDYIKLLENSLMKSIDNMAEIKKDDFDYVDYTCSLGMNNSQALEFLDLFGDDTLYRQAKKDYLELKKIVDNYTDTMENLDFELGGFNYEDVLNSNEYDKYFDVNYGRICITIKSKDNKIFLDDTLDIYDRDENMFENMFSIKKLLEYGEEE